MAITQTYIDYGTGNDYLGATFTDGAFTVADMTLTKAGAFAASSPGHWLYLDDNGSGNVTPGYYQIATVTSADAVVLAASPKSGATDPTDVVCTQADGTSSHPLRSLQGAADLLTREANDGNQINIIAGTAQVLSAPLDLDEVIAGAPLDGYRPLIIRGCTATANDGGVAEIDCNGATMFAATSYDFIVLRDLEIHNGGNNDMVVLDTYVQAINCEFHKGASTPNKKHLLKINTDGLVLGCYFHDAGTEGRGITVTSGLFVYGNTFDLTDGARIGLAMTGNPARCSIQRNVFRLNSTTAYAVYAIGAGGFWVFDNAIYNAAAGTACAVLLAGSRYGVGVANNIIAGFSGAGGEGIDVPAASGFNVFGYNAFYNNTANYTLGDVVHSDLGNDDTLGASPWVNAGTGDFDINGTVAGVTEDAYPAAFLGLASTSPKADKGAVQAGAGGGGGEAHLDSEVLDTATTPGTYHAPDAAEVISTAVFGVNSGTSGTYHAPEVSEVIDTASFGAASAETGTVHLPDAAEVIDTAVFGAASAVSGTWHAPDAAEVIDSAVFGPSSSIAGTYDTSGAAPTAAEIADAVWDELRNEHTGAGSFGAVSEWASTGGLDAAGVRAAVGLASANLDTQLLPLASLADDTDIATAVRTELATELARITGPVALEATLTAIKGAGWTTQTLVAIVAAIGSGGITAQQVRDALKLAPTAGAAADGSIDNLLAALPAAVEAELTGYQVNVQPVVGTDGQITLYQGYDYNSADNRAVEFTIASPDFTGATTALKFDTDTYAGAVVNPGLTTQLLRFEFTAVQTAAMTAGYHAYRLEVTRAGRLLLEETGVINVKE